MSSEAAPTPSPHPAASTGVNAAVVAASIIVALLLGAGPAALAYFSLFGPTPTARLPLLAVLLFGLLFVAAFQDLFASRHADIAAKLLTLAAAVAVASTAVTVVLGWGEWRYLLAPAVGVTVSAILIFWRRWRPAQRELWAAVLVYVSATLLANFTLDSFLPLGGFFLLNVGTLFFGLTFTQRDRVHRFGRRAVYQMIFVAAAANVLLAASLGTPLRYVAVSFFTIVLSETADTEVYQRLLHRRWLVRVAGSNAVSAPLDTVLFTLLAFWGEPFATPAWMTQVIVTDVVVKYGSGFLAALGMIALLRSVWPGASHEEAFAPVKPAPANIESGAG